jgi:hypothetical protein
MTDQSSGAQVITEAQAALVEIAQVRIAAQRLRLAQQREAGKLKGNKA